MRSSKGGFVGGGEKRSLPTKKPLAGWQGAFRLSFRAALIVSVAEEKNAGGFFFGRGFFGAGNDRTVEELVLVEVDLKEGWASGDVPSNQGLRERIFDVALQGAAQRTGSVAAIYKGFVENPLLGLVGDRDGDRLLGQIGIQTLHHQLDDLDEIGVRQRLEEDHLVDAVEELGIEGLLDFLLDQFLDLLRDKILAIALKAESLLLHQVARADIRGHDDD